MKKSRTQKYFSFTGTKLSSSKQQVDRIKNELRKVGAVQYDIWLPETKSLASVIHDNEVIHGVVFGRYSEGTGALVATNKRVIFIDKKFLFLKYDEIKYDVISAVSQSYIGPTGTIILHTRLGDYSLKTFNVNAARIFSDYIEKACLDRKENIND